MKHKQSIRLSLTLVVGNTLRLGRAGILGGKGQHDQGDDVGQHIVNGTGKVHGLQEGKAGQGVGGTEGAVAVAVDQAPLPADHRRAAGKKPE